MSGYCVVCGHHVTLWLDFVVAKSLMTISTVSESGSAQYNQERMSRRRSVELSVLAVVEVVLSHMSQTFTLYGKRPLRKSVKDKLAFVRYCKGLPYDRKA